MNVEVQLKKERKKTQTTPFHEVYEFIGESR